MERGKGGRKIVLITGTNSGIGFALANKLHRSEFSVVATTRERNVQKLREQLPEHENFSVLPLDVTSYESIEECVQTVADQYGPIDILINNAGISYRSVVEHMSREEEGLQLMTNYFGPMKLIRAVLPEMRHNCYGRIINVSSVGGMMAMPTMGSYSASKFALEGASEALWYELRPWNVSVTLVQLGFVKSESYQNVYWSKSAEQSRDDPNDDYHIYYKYMSDFVGKLMERSFATPERIAEKIIRTMKKDDPPLRLPVTVDAHLFYWIRRLLPRFVYHKLLYWNLPKIHEWEASAKRAKKEWG